MNGKVNKEVFANSNILKDALQIDITTPYGIMNITKSPVLGTAGNTANMPVGCNVGVREFYYFNDNWFIVKITELDPQMGRTWYRRYDKVAGKWYGWISA